MILSGTGLKKSYGSVKVLDYIDISISAGTVYGLLGPNGAGKSTLFKVLCGLIKPDAGKVIVNSNRPKPIGGIIEKPALYGYLNAHENLMVFAKIQGASTDLESINQSLLKVGLPIDRKDPVRNFSMGMKQRLGIAVALLNNPECLILDEPFSGLDPMGMASLRTLILELAENQKLAILISSHLIDELSKTCHILFVIKNGQIVNSGTTHKLLDNSTTSYSLCASNITHSEILKKYNPTYNEDCCTLHISSDEISDLMVELLKENIKITSCSPQLNMEKLFETTGK